jgi:hypothetical protein
MGSELEQSSLRIGLAGEACQLARYMSSTGMRAVNGQDNAEQPARASSPLSAIQNEQFTL